ncbi:hypothetical protein TRIUR3_11757 [Triticum urartu]|uniref:Reverse transcriptase zinc-binding domain-containing protein n=1 Tax=Triticum urartu TaxID=4572 RepID=M7ZXH7_TRIUA|nr:hypothetical protein TRIUR3_11757 [Triticum urartu]
MQNNRLLICLLLVLLKDFDHNAAAAAADGLPFSSKNTYHLLIGQPNHDISTHLILATRVPIKVQVFAWLLFKDHLNSKPSRDLEARLLFIPRCMFGASIKETLICDVARDSSVMPWLGLE